MLCPKNYVINLWVRFLRIVKILIYKMLIIYENEF